jgi:hypothetical protein
MRIIGQIEHPSLKISVFKNEGRTSVKFETAHYEQTYKLGDDERFATLEGVKQFVDNALIERTLEIFRQMHSTRLDVMARLYPVQAGEVFENII